ncbi:DUF7793 family protein [Olleya namhaensis]|uniref:DUF7793 domain-containing protein n=1 Tax=Olleya namhaensis TaxID=1144750 RepID=A0A1I3MQT5_9FLAO|nr:hypothetical protein [Olleya namhaensis]SFI99312.1 hypothetical protein SAMN05443431_103263 [Olleya namhaensis]
MSNIITIGHAKFWKEYNKSVFFQFSDDDAFHNLDLNTAKKYIDVMVKLCDGKPMPFIIDLRGFRGTFSTEAASFIAKSPILEKLRISQAFIVNSIGTKLLIASYKRLYDPITPYHVFSDLGLAEQYCLETKNEFHGSC